MQEMRERAPCGKDGGRTRQDEGTAGARVPRQECAWRAGNGQDARVAEAQGARGEEYTVKAQRHQRAGLCLASKALVKIWLLLSVNREAAARSSGEE